MKPRLVESNIINKIVQDNNIQRNDNITNGLKYIGDCIVYITINYIDFFLLAISIVLILYYRYRLHSSGKKNPDEIVVNYYRNKNIYDDNTVTINDNIKSDYDLDDELLKTVQEKVKEVDYELQPVNSTMFNDYSI
tara:strand:- start:2962 stop:3369 length:408 start_codon:yes stop_codon:yes gene_type:complete